MMVRGQFAQLMAPGLHGTFVHWLQLKQRDEEYTKIFNIEPSTKAYEDEVEFSGIGPMEVKPEAEGVVYKDATQGGTKRYINRTFALGVRTSLELYEDDQYDIIKQIPKAIARSAHFTNEQQAFNVINLGFTTSLTIDGVSLFNNQHPLLGGAAATGIAPGLTNIISAAGTYPNRPAVDVDFSHTALQLAINQYERMIDSTGFPIQVKPKFVLIPPPLKWIAREILGSSHKPYTADNEINSILNEDLSYFVGHYLTSDTAWFLLPDKADHTLKVKDRRSLDEKFSDDFDTQSLKQIAFFRRGYGVTNWIGTWGSNGP